MYKFYCVLLLSPSLCLAAPQQVLGFGDASPDEIAQIRAGTYGETFDENPQYSFNYKVADSEEQTYMAMDESRDGDQVTGSYQYVDPLGSLIIVTYTAGVMGYSETREVKPNYIEVRERPASSSSASSSSAGSSFSGNSGSSFSGSSGSSFSDSGFSSANNGFSSSNNGFSSSSSNGFNTNDIVSTVVSNIQPLISSTVSNAVSNNNRRPVAPLAPPPLTTSNAASSGFNSGSSSSAFNAGSTSSFNSNDIVNQVVSNISPLISSTVSNAVQSNSGSTRFVTRPAVSRPISAPAPAPRRPAPTQAPFRPAPAASNAGGSITDLFGSGDQFNVRFNTPSFNIEY